MGVGRPSDMVGSVARGIDMFDCVMPTRSAARRLAFTRRGDLNMRNARHATTIRARSTSSANAPPVPHHVPRLSPSPDPRPTRSSARCCSPGTISTITRNVMRGLRGAIESKSLDSWIASFESEQALGDIPPL
jgi:queuine tRNA-ribosyltransferase